MSVQSKTVIKSYFVTGATPTQAQFVDLVDSYQDVGSGGAVTGPASSVDSQITLFSGTSGALLKAATTTGLLKASSGVIAAANSGTDYAPPTSGSSFLKGNGSGGFTNQSTINLTDLATQASNSVLAEATGSTAAPTAVSLTTQTVLGRLGGNITAVGVGTAANNLVQLDGSSKLPAVDGSQLTNLSASGSYTLLSTQTASNSASLAFTSVITSAYDYYVFILQDIRPATDGDDLLLQTSANNGVAYDTAGNYAWAATGTTFDTPTAIAISGQVADTSFSISGAKTMDNGTASCMSGRLELFSPNGIVKRKFIRCSTEFTTNGPAIIALDVIGYHNATAAVNAVKFFGSTGNITTGKIYCYGIKNT